MGKALGLPLVRRKITRREADVLKVARYYEIEFSKIFPESYNQPAIRIIRDDRKSYGGVFDVIRTIRQNEGYVNQENDFEKLIGLWFRDEEEANKVIEVDEDDDEDPSDEDAFVLSGFHSFEDKDR